jgi:LmbE family N-acetylglucosaminyl deacetylase
MRLLAIGAHPDDIEIGASALISKAVRLGMETYFLILTDDGDEREARRGEAVQAAAILGVPRDRVFFAGLRDGLLRADRKSVARVREIFPGAETKPDVIVTHTAADSHNDHVEASRLAHAAFRECIFLHFSIYLSSERDRFAPRVFVEVSPGKLEQKTRALALHDSQRERLERRDLSVYEETLGKLAHMGRAEAFEVSPQEGAAGIYDRILTLSESPFHRFWSRIVAEKDITLFYEAYGAPGAPIDWPTSHANAGRDQLRQAFRDQWLPYSPLRETGSGTGPVQRILESESVILAGGAVSNLLVRDVYNRFRSTVWAVDYEMPRLEPAFLYNRSTGVRFYPEYDARNNVMKDFGVIARVANPYAPGEHVVCAAGATGLGTRVALEFLSDPASDRKIAKHFESRGDVQVAFSVKAGTSRLKIVDVCHA